MRLLVESRIEKAGEAIPFAFYLGKNRIEVIEIVDRWPALDCSYFKIRSGENEEYILRHDKNAEYWELVKFGRAC